jgi:hypothetical protein
MDRSANPLLDGLVFGLGCCCHRLQIVGSETYRDNPAFRRTHWQLWPSYFASFLLLFQGLYTPE